jgi:hypothetical protein
MSRPAVTCMIMLILAVSTAPAAWADTSNLVANPGLEGAGPGQLPPGWAGLDIGPPADFAIDPDVRRTGRQSARIHADETVRSYLQSQPIAVAPGEIIRASAWVRFQDVPADAGNVTIIAEFSRADGGTTPVQKVGDAKVPPDGRSDWQQVAGSVTVPGLATHMRLRLGFSYSRGMAWWDDVTVEAAQPLVARLELPSPRISPARRGIPVTILNREQQRGPAEVQVTLGEQTRQQRVRLTGDTIQQVEVPVEITARGRIELALELAGPGSPPTRFSQKRQVVIPPPLVLGPPIPTHWAVEDGPATITGDISLALADSARSGATLAVHLVDERGATLASWSPPRGARIDDGVTEFILQAPELPLGKYRIIAELRPRRGEAVRGEQTWTVIPRRLARVTLNSDGYPEYDGMPIFPLGVYNGTARMAEMGDAGFTISHAYNAVEAMEGDRLADGRALDFMNATADAGMKAILLVPRHPLFAEDWETVRRRIRMFRNHPGLLAWNTEEGIARGDMPPETLAKLYEIVREEDPHHPLMVGDSRDAIGRVTDRSDFFPIDHMDLGMWWWYPLPPGGARANILEGEELVEAKELAPPSFLTLRKTDKPIWVGVQSYKKPQPWARYPLPIEYRAQAYIAVIHGARGLMWYGGSVQGGIFLNLEEGNWTYLKELVGELREMSDVFMAPDDTPPAFEPPDARLSVALKRLPERLVLLAVNRSAEPVEVTFRSDRFGAGPADVLYEDRQVQIEAHTLRDRFEPYETHVYELRP